MSSKTEGIFNAASKEANRSECNYRMGSVVCKKRILGKACNTYRTHPLTNDNPNYMRGLHAEIAACLNTHRSQLEGADVFVVRLLSNGSRARARPCGICQDVLSRFGIHRIFYSVGDDEYGVLAL